MKNTSKDCGCSDNGSDARYHEECLEQGKKSILLRIEREARDALASLPSDEELKKISKIGQQLISKLSELYASASLASRWEDEKLRSFVDEMAWVKHICDVQISFMDNSNDSDGDSSTNCVQVYDECIENHGCDTSGWFCVCCAPCSIKYSRCIFTGSALSSSTYSQFA